MGYLHQTIGINARIARNRTAWQPHLEQSRDFVLNAAANCPQRRKAVLMGAAVLHDLPVERLANLFDEVVLVDLFHLWPARWLTFTKANITLQVCDLTASLDLLGQGTRKTGTPSAFLDDADVDFVVSANIASQLPLIPMDWLARQFSVDEQTRHDLGQELVASHFRYLQKFTGTTCLISDSERLVLDETGAEISRTTALFDIVPPPATTSWTWDIAPLGETEPNRAISHIVIGAVLGQNSTG
jgi:hypothetical protein